MKFLGLGVPELIIILVVILLIFGPKNLPKLGKAFGKSVSNLREGMNEGKKQAEGAAEGETADAEAADDDGKTPHALEAAVEEVEEVVGADDDAMGNADDADNVDTAEEAPKKVVKKVVRKKVDAE